MNDKGNKGFQTTSHQLDSFARFTRTVRGADVGLFCRKRTAVLGLGSGLRLRLGFSSALSCDNPNPEVEGEGDGMDADLQVDDLVVVEAHETVDDEVRQVLVGVALAARGLLERGRREVRRAHVHHLARRHVHDVVEHVEDVYARLVDRADHRAAQPRELLARLHHLRRREIRSIQGG